MKKILLITIALIVLSTASLAFNTEVLGYGLVLDDGVMVKRFAMSILEGKMRIVAWSLTIVTIIIVSSLVLFRKSKYKTIIYGLASLLFALITSLIILFGIQNIGCPYCTLNTYQPQSVIKVLLVQNLQQYMDCSIPKHDCKPSYKVIPIEPSFASLLMLLLAFRSYKHKQSSRINKPSQPKQ